MIKLLITNQGYIMRINNNKNLYMKTDNINKCYIGFHENNETTNDIILHNNILSLYINYIKNKKLLSLKYFKILLPLYYKFTFNKTIIYKNINYDITLKENLITLLNDYSVIQLYKIMLYYINDDDIDIKQLTAMFYSTLYYINKEISTDNGIN